MKRLVFVGLLALGGMTLGCTPRMFGDIARAAVFTAAVVGTAAVLAEHDAHFHGEACGCPRQWHDGHWIFYYGSGWEYYDSQNGVWYRLQ
jgi:hypothetical protein